MVAVVTSSLIFVVASQNDDSLLRVKWKNWKEKRNEENNSWIGQDEVCKVCLGRYNFISLNDIVLVSSYVKNKK